MQVGNVSWKIGLQKLVWEIGRPGGGMREGMLRLNSTVWFTRNTTGDAPSNSPPVPLTGIGMNDSPHCPDARRPGFESWQGKGLLAQPPTPLLASSRQVTGQADSVTQESMARLAATPWSSITTVMGRAMVESLLARPTAQTAPRTSTLRRTGSTSLVCFQSFCRVCASSRLP